MQPGALCRSRRMRVLGFRRRGIRLLPLRARGGQGGSWGPSCVVLERLAMYSVRIERVRTAFCEAWPTVGSAYEAHIEDEKNGEECVCYCNGDWSTLEAPFESLIMD